MKKWTGITLMTVALLFILSNINNKEFSEETPKEVVEPKYEYGILVDTFNVTKGRVQQGQTLGEILYTNHIDHAQIADAVEKSKHIFDFRRVNAGKKYTIICSKDSNERACYFIYEEDPMNYVVMDFVNEIDVYMGKKEVIKKVNIASGEINSSLWLTIEEQKLSPKIAAELSTIYAWTIDFF